MDDPEDLPPPARAKPSKTPSWVMLGFVLGARAMLALPRFEKIGAPPVTVTLVAPPPPGPAAPEKPTVERALFFEAVFAEWSKYAGWENELTEVAFWNGDTKSFSDRFEVFRSGERFYFRSITQFTRPLLTHGVPDNSPLQFTESQAARDEWLRENAAENLRAFLGPPPKKTQ
jgi:hypothetical protein